MKRNINVRVEDATLDALHALTAQSKTAAFGDVAGELLDKATMPNTHLIVVPPEVLAFYEHESYNSGIPVETLMSTVVGFYAKDVRG